MMMQPGNKFISDKAAMGGKKRKASCSEDEAGQQQRKGKRAALGEITNKSVTTTATSTITKGGNFIAGLLRKSLRRGSKKVVEKLTEQEKETKIENESYGESESSTEILGCGLLESSADTSTGSEEGAQVSLPLPEPDFTIISPARPIVPQGVEDYDLLTKEDPTEVAEYARDIFKYYQTRESKFTVSDYMRAQTDLTPIMRAILIDWMVEVQESFEFNHETLYAAVKIVDIYLSKKKVAKDNLQLVGASALLLASKVEELMPPMVSDFVYVCDDAYTRDALLSMERKMLKVVGFDVGFPLSYSYLRRYAKVCKVGLSDLTFARYILETSLLHYDLNIHMLPSVLAVSALVLVFKIRGIVGCETALEYYSGYSLCDLKNTVLQLHVMLQTNLPEQVETVRSKYSHKVFHRVATIPIPATIDI
jgi:hypothetical protein